MIAKLIHYSGNVQGVGFRATASMMARNYPVTGWVRNLGDGRVQMVVEGEAQAVDQFLQAIRERWMEDLEDVQIESRDPTGQYTRFEIAG